MINYRPSLGDQDWFTDVGFDHPELFYILPCQFNAQTTLQVRYTVFRGMLTKFADISPFLRKNYVKHFCCIGIFYQNILSKITLSKCYALKMHEIHPCNFVGYPNHSFVNVRAYSSLFDNNVPF